MYEYMFLIQVDVYITGVCAVRIPVRRLSPFGHCPDGLLTEEPDVVIESVTSVSEQELIES